MVSAVAAVDLGATSGRVIVGYVSENTLSLRPIARFANTPVHTIDGLHWDILNLYSNVLDGLRTAIREEKLKSVAVDSWAVDYGLLHQGRMLGEPYHYRDDRNVTAVKAVRTKVSDEALYAANGLQFLPFNTLYQLSADLVSGALEDADAFLLIPDLINYWLTGRQFAERTNASTTGLLGVSTGQWNTALIDELGLPPAIFPDLVDAGTPIGGLLPEVITDLAGGQGLALCTVGSHDTASAVVAVPTITPNFAYISCGTWGLVGVELDSPVLTEESRIANFTNEGGVDGRFRYLHNVMGLWLLTESVREWESDGTKIDIPSLVNAASELTAPVAPFDPNDPRFLAPGDLPSRIAEWYGEHNLPAPRSKVEIVRCIIESLATAFAEAINTASSLSGKQVDVVHLVGGGSQNALLCQLTANLSGRPVLAGPVETTAVGNVLIQARTRGLVSGSLESLRSLVAEAFAPIKYLPR
jgi:rhamnulokinase